MRDFEKLTLPGIDEQLDDFAVKAFEESHERMRRAEIAMTALKSTVDDSVRSELGDIHFAAQKQAQYVRPWMVMRGLIDQEEVA